MVNGMADVRVIEDPKEIKAVRSPQDKAFLRVLFQDGTQVDMTLNLAGMLGGVGQGVIKRHGYE